MFTDYIHILLVSFSFLNIDHGVRIALRHWNITIELIDFTENIKWQKNAVVVHVLYISVYSTWCCEGTFPYAGTGRS